MKLKKLYLISSLIAMTIVIGACSNEASQKEVKEDTQISEQVELDVLEMKENAIVEMLEEPENIKNNNESKVEKDTSVPIGSQVQWPFYGIWCQATKDYNEACEYANKLRNAGFSAQVIDTSMWSNLNSGWYAVTAGVYDTKEAATADLSYVKANYKDAYVKYSGNYKGQNQPNIQEESFEQSNAVSDSNVIVDENPPFYGIWCQATTDYNEAERYAAEFRNLGFAALVIKTDDWSNLNNGWYAVSVGIYDSKEAADAVLSDVKVYYNDAYVKYSGNHQ